METPELADHYEWGHNPLGQTVWTGGGVLRDQFKDESGLRTLIPTNYPDVYKLLQDKNVTVDIKEANSSHWVSMLINAIPFVLLLAFWIFMMRQMQSGG